MFKVAVAVCTLGFLPSTSDAVAMRRSGVVGATSEHANTTIDASSFSPAFVASVDAALFPSAEHATFLSAKVTPHGSLMHLAARGAAELDVDKAVASFSPPPNVVDLLRQGHKAAAGANMWKADVDTKVVEKAIVNLNGMVFEAQKRLDAKNDECEEFKVKYTETLDQINGDLARMGEELSNSARAISVHMGGISANTLNTQQTKEELQRELLAYTEVRNADMIVLQERQTNLKVSAFILVFSACPDAPSASASLVQSTLNTSSQSTSTDVQTCVNETSGRNDLRFENNRLDDAAQKLSTEAQDVLMRFIAKEQSLKGGRRIAEAASQVEAFALSEVQDMSTELDDGDVDSTDSDEGDDVVNKDVDSQETSFLETKKKQDPCGVPVERIAIPDKKGCHEMPASCCTCNKYYTTADGHGNDAMGWCTFVPEERLCQSGKFIEDHPQIYPQMICGEPVDDYYDEPPPEEVKAANRCTNAKIDCGVLHDMFAGLWGETKDLVDELTWKMNQDTAAWEKVKRDINSLLQIQATQMSNLQSALAEATAQKAAQIDEQGAKQKEKVDTTKLFDDTMKECQDTMKQILYMEICGVLAVRNNIIAKNLPGEPTPTDCSVGEFVASDCSVSCDDDLQGGVHNLAREVITMNSKRGVACPALSTTRKCKQIPCPVECELSHWSNWGKCSKECGGGVQSQTRSLEVKPKNGGKACDAKMQSQPCNTDNCDQDCELGKWMDFQPCTKACNAGYEERRKRVLSEAKGDGQCLPWNDKNRLERKPCNTHACSGDEMCNSSLDLVIAIDSSGSITEAGFDILKEFALKLVKRMMAPVQVGVVLFGNGKLDFKTNVISDAKVMTDNLEGDMESVGKKIDGMIIHKGFTNMAQAFMKSKDVLTYSRKGAAAAVLVITDGRPSFKFQTGHAVMGLRKSARVMIVHVQANKKKEMAELLRTYVSEPDNANYRFIAGKSKLAKAFDSYATSVIADLCPTLVSPSAVTECTLLDGSGPSKAYPCECGAAMCKQGEVCHGEDQYCIDPKLMFVQSSNMIHHK